MSQENVELVKSLYAAFARRNFDFILKNVSPEIEIVQSSEVPWGGSYRGPAEMQDFYGKLGAHLQASGLPIERALDAGDCVVIIGRTQGTVRATGKHFDVPLAHVWQIRDGKVTRFMPFIDHPTMFASLR